MKIREHMVVSNFSLLFVLSFLPLMPLCKQAQPQANGHIVMGPLGLIPPKLHKSSDSDSEVLAPPLLVGQPVTIIEQSEKTDYFDGYRGHWYLVKFADKQGWIFGSYIEFEGTNPFDHMKNITPLPLQDLRKFDDPYDYARNFVEYTADIDSPSTGQIYDGKGGENLGLTEHSFSTGHYVFLERYEQVVGNRRQRVVIDVVRIPSDHLLPFADPDRCTSNVSLEPIYLIFIPRKIQDCPTTVMPSAAFALNQTPEGLKFSAVPAIRVHCQLAHVPGICRK